MNIQFSYFRRGCKVFGALFFLLSGQQLAAETDAGILGRVTELEEVLERIESTLDRVEGLLEASVQPWEPVAPTIHDFSTWMRSDRRLLRYEFGIMRNGGFRIVQVSTWNGGYRFMTEPFWRGDVPANFGLGANIWLIGTDDPADVACSGNTAKHYYVMFENGKAELNNSNGCTAEGPVYARKRLFAEDLK